MKKKFSLILAFIVIIGLVMAGCGEPSASRPSGGRPGGPSSGGPGSGGGIDLISEVNIQVGSPIGDKCISDTSWANILCENVDNFDIVKTWRDANNNKLEFPYEFKDNAIYYVDVTLVPKPGFSFADLHTITFNGKPRSDFQRNSDGTVTFTESFNTGEITGHFVEFNYYDGEQWINEKRGIVDGKVNYGFEPKHKNKYWKFDGWFTDTGFTNEWDFTVPLNGPVELHAKWIPMFTGSDIAVPIQFNSNDLLNLTNPITWGWYAKTESGKWRIGRMVLGGQRTIEIPATNQLFAFNDFNKLSRDISGNLIGGIGRWWTERVVPAQGPPAPSVKVHFQLYIPYDRVEIWMYPSQTNQPVSLAQQNLNYRFPTPTDDGWFHFPHGAGAPNYSINIRIHALSYYAFEEDLENGYPVFETGNNTYFWKDGDHNRWNLGDTQSSQVNFIKFEPKQNGTQDEIIIRAFDLSDPAVSFMPNPAGLDKQVTTLNTSHYSSLVPVSDLIIDGVKVGTVDVTLIDHKINDGVLTNISIRVTYTFDPDFVPFLDTIEANGAAAEGSGLTRTVDLEMLPHGPITLRTDFTFKTLTP
jgi:hypothetical protein